MPLRVVHARTEQRDARAAIEALGTQLQCPEGESFAVIILYCSADTDLVGLGPCLKEAFKVPIVACTSSGQIGEWGYEERGIDAIGIIANELRVVSRFFDLRDAHSATLAAMELGREPPPSPGWRRFGLVLVDGLSHQEESLMSTLYQHAGNLRLVGGSAGDNQRFEQTGVYFDGAFHSDAAVVTVFETTLPFAPFKFQHFIPSEQRLIVTEADPSRRIVQQINGQPAALAYARAIGCRLEELSPMTFSRHPLGVVLADQLYVRSIQSVTPDLGLQFFCAIETGTTCRTSLGIEPIECAERAFSSLASEGMAPALILGFDCILRRLQLEAEATVERMDEVMRRHRVFGFNTYGEQLDSVHMNQTFTGIALGLAPVDVWPPAEPSPSTPPQPPLGSAQSQSRAAGGEWDDLDPPSLRRCIEVLVQRIEKLEKTEQGTHFGRQVELERLVAAKTKELFEEDAKLKVALWRLADAQDDLLEARKLEAIGQISAGIAHEINTPIQFVGDNLTFLAHGFSGLLAIARHVRPQTGDAALTALIQQADLDYLEAEGPDAFSQCHEGLRRVATIIASMKRLAHPGSSVPESVDINAALEASVVISRPECRMVADVRTSYGPLPNILGFEVELSQVFLNLIVNAAHAIADKGDGRGTITVTSWMEDTHALVRISDTGTGIPPDVFERIYDQFFTTKDVGRGTGQGLALAKAVVQKHNGTISCDSRVGEGTHFTIRIPTVELPKPFAP